MDDDYQMFKIVVIGSTGTGKTNIATRYIRNQFNEGQKATVGVEFLSKVVKVRNQNIKVTLWDTAGQQRYKSLSKVYYKGASGVLIVFDITEPQSYLDIESWLRLANQNLNLNEVVLMVVGNKVDLQHERKVPKDRLMREYQEKFDIDCWEVSAKSGEKVKELFAELLEKIYEKNIQIKDNDSSDDDRKETPAVGARKKATITTQPKNPYPEIVVEVPKEQQIRPENIPRKPQPKTVINNPPKVEQKPGKIEPKVTKNDNKITLNAADQKKRAKESKEKKKGCC